MSTETKERFVAICHEKIGREGIAPLMEWLGKSDFFSAPASSKFHSSHEGGLAEHSLNVYDSLVAINERQGKPYTDETVAIVALFHDLCKVNFYRKGYRNVKNDATGQWERREVWEIDEKFPFGHGEKSCIILSGYMRLSTDELLAIRHHMGGFDSAVKGGDYSLTRAFEKCPLAVMLHMADLEATYLKESSKE